LRCDTRIGFTSCDDDDYDVIPNALGDAYIKTVKIGDEVKHGLVLYAYSNLSMESAKVATPDVDADSISLESYKNRTDIFRSYPTEDADFSTDIPEAGNYSFVVNLENGKTLNRTDELKGDTLALADISESSIIENDVNVKWSEVEGAYTYIIRLTNANDDVIFESKDIYIKENETSREITINSANFDFNIEDVKKIKLISIKFESTNNPNASEVESISEEVKVIE